VVVAGLLPPHPMIARLFVLLGDTKDITCCVVVWQKSKAAAACSRAAGRTTRNASHLIFGSFARLSSRGEH